MVAEGAAICYTGFGYKMRKPETLILEGNTVSTPSFLNMSLFFLMRQYGILPVYLLWVSSLVMIIDDMFE